MLAALHGVNKSSRFSDDPKRKVNIEKDINFRYKFQPVTLVQF